MRSGHVMEAIPLGGTNEGLVIVEPGPDVLLTPDAALQVTEWIDGWAARDRLFAAGITPPGPLFLHGPPGTGKTAVTRMLARKLAGVRPVFVVDGMRVTSQYMGVSAANLSKASDTARAAGGVLVLEEVDTLAMHRSHETGAEVENSRSATAIMRILELGIPVILTSNRLDVIDPAVIRRCEYIVSMPDPSPAQRRAIVERELGCDPGPVALQLTVALPLARRARRTAALRGGSAAVAFATLSMGADTQRGRRKKK
jgi:SpoVK/Ycf46/Vps4 family AAA+-type ATPase